MKRKNFAADIERKFLMQNQVIAIDKNQLLQQRVFVAAFLNLLIVACLGVLLRSFPFLNNFVLTYKNVLHGHSHFAFGGWLMPVLVVLVWKFFPEVTGKINYYHRRNILVLLLFSAYGMLLSFPVQGYGLVSIIFSTLSVFASFYFSYCVWTALPASKSAAHQFLKWSLVYLVLSAAGPFATGPLIAIGYQGSSAYYNAIYFYLHFQYNGFFLFVVFAIIYKMLEASASSNSGAKVFTLMNLACIPTYFLSVLWNGPAEIYYWIGGAGAALQLVALYYFLRDAKNIVWKEILVKNLFSLVLIFFVMKFILQLLSAVPFIAELAASYRNFVIAYLHLVLLGIISLFTFAVIFQSYSVGLSKQLRIGIVVFLFSFISTESLLILQSVFALFSRSFAYYNEALLLCSCFFPVSIFIICNKMQSTLSTKSFHFGKFVFRSF